MIGSTVNLKVQGDEYLNWLSDTDGYAVVQKQSTGSYVYAVPSLAAGGFIPTSLQVYLLLMMFFAHSIMLGCETRDTLLYA